jgi:hypothetical protein
MATADETISWDWSGYWAQQDAVNPSVMTASSKYFDHVNYLDGLDFATVGDLVTSSWIGTTVRVLLRPYHKTRRDNAVGLMAAVTSRCFHLFPLTPYLLRTGAGIAFQALNPLQQLSQQARAVAGGEEYLLPPAMRGYLRRFLRTVFQEVQVILELRTELPKRSRQETCIKIFKTHGSLGD